MSISPIERREGVEHCLERIFDRETAFAITRQGTLYTIADSSQLPRMGAIEFIAKQKYCPIMSPRRRGGLLEFTLVPYNKPDAFAKSECESKVLPREELWRSVEAIQSLAGKEDSPIYVQGIKMFDSLSLAKQQMMASCGSMSSLVRDYICEAARTGKVLDLGCARGMNSIPFLENKWTVVAVDISREALDLFQAAVPENKRKQLTLANLDVTTSEFPSAHNDLVICVDVLPYIASSKLRSVLEKIYKALSPNGTFIGTMFFSTPDAENSTTKFQAKSVELLRRLGAHFYLDPSIIPAMLEDVGFHIDQCSFRRDSSLAMSMCVEFLATKASK